MIVTKMTEGGEGMAIPAILVAVVTAIVVGGACGAFNGFIIGYFNIPAMLVTPLRTAALHRSCLWNYRRSGNQRYV